MAPLGSLFLSLLGLAYTAGFGFRKQTCIQGTRPLVGDQGFGVRQSKFESWHPTFPLQDDGKAPHPSELRFHICQVGLIPPFSPCLPVLLLMAHICCMNSACISYIHSITAGNNPNMSYYRPHLTYWETEVQKGYKTCPQQAGI